MPFSPSSDIATEVPIFTPGQEYADEIESDSTLGSFARGAGSKAVAGVGGLAGAIAGAEAGAGIGTMVTPGIGTLLGGVVGGIAGAMGGSALGTVFNKKLRGEE